MPYLAFSLELDNNILKMGQQFIRFDLAVACDPYHITF